MLVHSWPFRYTLRAMSSGDDQDAHATMQTHFVCGLEFRVMDSGQRART